MRSLYLPFSILQLAAYAKFLVHRAGASVSFGHVVHLSIFETWFEKQEELQVRLSQQVHLYRHQYDSSYPKKVQLL